MKKIVYKSSVLLFCLITTLGFGGSVYAENAIDVEYNNGNNVNGGKIFNEKDVYPGWSKAEKIVIKNKSTESGVDLYMTFDINDGKTLADALKLYVIKNDSGSYRVGGAGDRYTLKKADGDRLFIGTLDPGEKEKYKIKIKFDEDSGNEYQKLSTKFDINFTIEGETLEGLTPQQILAAQGRTVSGAAPEDEMGNNGIQDARNETQEKLDGTSGGDDEHGRVAGVAATCHRWPIWVWIIIVTGYGLLAVIVGKNTHQRETRVRHYFWQILFAAMIVLVWYFFETCRLYPWVPILTVIGGFLIIFLMRGKRDEN